MSHSALRFKSGKGKSVRIDKIRAQNRDTARTNFNHIRTIFLTVALFAVSFLFIIGLVFFNKLNARFVSADSYTSYDSDVTSFSYIVVDSFTSNPIQLKKLNFIVLDKISNKTVIFDIPLDMELNLPGKYADMPISKTFALGGLNSENKLQGGVDLLNLTLFKMFGFPVTNYVLVEDSLSLDMDSLLYKGKSVFPFGGLSITNMKSSFSTSFSLSSFYQTQQFLSSVKEDSFIKKTLSAEDLSSTDDIFEDMTLSSEIAKEKKTIAVLNGTDLSGVATLGSRVIKNMGGRVVAIENALDKGNYPNTVLIVDDMNFKTVSYIKKSFNISTVYTKEESPFTKESSIDRSDITLILGFDLANQIY